MSNTAITLALYHGAELLRRVNFESGIIKLGSDVESHLHLEGPDIARLHAIIEVSLAGDATFVQLGNGEPARVDGKPVQRAGLREGSCIDVSTLRVIVESIDKPAAAAQPFGEPTSNPFATARARDECPEDNAHRAYSYELLKSGPAVADSEVEASAPAIEVTISWDDNVLHVAHLSPPRPFFVGESGEQDQADFYLPVDSAQAGSLPLISGDRDHADLLVPAAASGHVQLPERGRMTVEQARSEAARPGHSGAPASLSVPLVREGRALVSSAELELGGFRIRIGAMRAGKSLPKGLGAGLDTEVFSYFGMSVATIGGLLATMAYFSPPLALHDESELSKDRLMLIEHYLASSAEQERETSNEAAPEENSAQEGGTGTAAQGASGALGKTSSEKTNNSYGVKGPKDNPDPHLARQAALREAREYGMIGLLNAGLPGDPDAPTAPWGRDSSLGLDERSAQGGMWGEQIGENFGGGLGLTGIGEGAGGKGKGIGVGEFGGLGHGAGTGIGHGWGPGRWGQSGSRLGRDHEPTAPSPISGVTEVSGHLPAEVIRRIVRQNFGRFRLCYEQGLLKNPNLEGRVAVRFVIGRDGAVSNAGNGGSDMPDSQVVSCVVSAFYGLSFPPPDAGIVSVTYPIMFQPG